MEKRLVAVDGKNGITYIGEFASTNLDLIVGAITLENFVVVPTNDLKNTSERSYCENVE